MPQRMTMLRLKTTLICLTLSLAAVAADAPEGRSIAYRKLYEPLAAVRSADPQDIVSSTLRAEPAQPDQPLPADLKIELRSGATHQPITLGQDGSFKLPMNPDWARSDATLWINQPKSAVKIVELFTMRTPTAAQLTYGELMESLPVLERIQKQKVEIAGLMPTAPQGVELAYDPGTAQTITIGTGAKAKTWNTDDQGHVMVPFDPALPATTPVMLSALPTALQPYAKQSPGCPQASGPCMQGDEDR